MPCRIGISSNVLGGRSLRQSWVLEPADLRFIICWSRSGHASRQANATVGSVDTTAGVCCPCAPIAQVSIAQDFNPLRCSGKRVASISQSSTGYIGTATWTPKARGEGLAPPVRRNVFRLGSVLFRAKCGDSIHHRGQLKSKFYRSTPSPGVHE